MGRAGPAGLLGDPKSRRERARFSCHAPSRASGRRGRALPIFATPPVTPLAEFGTPNSAASARRGAGRRSDRCATEADSATTASVSARAKGPWVSVAPKFACSRALVAYPRAGAHGGWRSAFSRRSARSRGVKIEGATMTGPLGERRGVHASDASAIQGRTFSSGSSHAPLRLCTMELGVAERARMTAEHVTTDVNRSTHRHIPSGGPARRRRLHRRRAIAWRPGAAHRLSAGPGGAVAIAKIFAVKRDIASVCRAALARRIGLISITHSSLLLWSKNRAHARVGRDASARLGAELAE